ncbi:Short-chain dehydrogenase involved in D-alanine esterification of teichoic acids [Nakamurella panacisegetis]|uniref:Short-chain dehydrogenase involved in D-alanine esterification of teichoic acids n=1 Tax=Nakamurella panacisegetis TaxID=1090615 RepID=A0A1H0LMZ5_9ACTN|nr:SDR family NAD(P)-dependent oxidoreductase [Nakamurella panacisegetis]SDO69361.1 Short-chain dehydrogenase involved in D-alanine esterification of teichoic acids [Nakamurella panacisegetis]
MNITNNTVFIPGATSGIGLALAARLQAKGNTVIIGGRRTALLDRLATEYGFGTVQIDTADPDRIASASVEVVDRYPDLNMVIAMAGIMEPEDWHRREGFLDIAERTVTTNLLGPIRLFAGLIDHLRRRPAATIVTVSSGLAFVPLAQTPTYNATKAAIHMLSEGIRLQLADTNIEVIEIVPPAVRTTLMNLQESEDAMPLDDFADETIRLLEAQENPGEILVDNVKFLRHAAERGDYDQVVRVLNGRH